MRIACLEAAWPVLWGCPWAFFFAFLFQTGLDPIYPPGSPEAIKQAQETTWQQVVRGWKQQTKHGWQNAKTFALLGLMWSSSECWIEKYRGKTDIWNSISAGCLTGAILGARGGIGAMGFGCGGMAAFSVLMDYFILGHGRHW